MHMHLFRGRRAVSITIVFLLVGAPLLVVLTGPVAAQDNILLVTRTQDEIVLDGSADEDGWTNAIPASIEVERNSNNIAVETRALYDEQFIYMSFTWADESLSVIPQQWQYTGGSWASIPHKEDRISILWNTEDSIIGFEQNKQACIAACHQDEFKTGTSQERGDLWQWMAGRTNPSTQVPDVGWMDDLELTDLGIVPDDFTGSKVWDMNSVYAFDDNETTDPFSAGDMPKYKEGNTPPNDDPAFLFRGFETAITDPTDFADGTTLPGYLLSKPSPGKDRADIGGKAVYDSDAKKWTLEIKRELETGNADDIQFDNLLNIYSFGMAVFDNQAGGTDTAYRSELVTLRFEVPELAVLSAVPSLASPIIGDMINMTVKVKNLGGYSTGFTVAMYVDDVTSEAIQTRPYVEMLSSFEEEFNFTWDTTGVDPGNHTLFVKADSDDLIAEQDKENNVVPVEIWVYPPVSEFKSNKKDPEEDTKIKLTASIYNPSNIDINVTVVFYKGDEVLDTQSPVNITAGETVDVIYEWKAKKEGKHTFRVILQGAENSEMTTVVNVKAASPGPGLIMVALAVTLAACVALVARRRQ